MANTTKRTNEAYWRGTSAATQAAQEGARRNPAAANAVPAILQKDHAVAAILAFVGGMLGIHKFYLGYFQTAFVMMAVSIVGGIFTFGLAAAAVWIIGIVEGVIYASCRQSDFTVRYVEQRRDWF